MPMVNGKKYPYTPAGKAAAEKAMKKITPAKGKGSMMGKPSRTMSPAKGKGSVIGKPSRTMSPAKGLMDNKVPTRRDVYNTPMDRPGSAGQPIPNKSTLKSDMNKSLAVAKAKMKASAALKKNTKKK